MAESSGQIMERRKTDRRKPVSQCQDDTCISLIVTESRLTQLANEFYDYKKSCHEEQIEATTERKIMLEKLNSIESALDKQRGFFSGVVWLGTGIIAAAGAVISYLKN